MTTIATDGKSMASDGRCIICDVVSGRSVKKIRRLKDGSLLAVSGEQPDLDVIAKWLEDGEGKKPKIGDSHALRLMPDGKLLYYCGGLSVSPIDVPFAIGSGSQFALGAMDAGASPEKAVSIASERDPNSGGKVTVLHLDAADA